MVKSLNLNNKLTLVNAPAGSGKTTLITDTVKELVKKTDKAILCITYTNRAADQLSNNIENENVEIGTIHSFIGNFMKPFFKLKDVIEFYIETYLCEIDFILKDNSEKALLKKERYAEKYNIQLNQITMELIKENIKFLEYSETPYNSYLYGRLSHDELLIFTEKLFSKYPKLQKTMSYRYAYIFIDEYQDSATRC